tara:strand:+ start:9828 stop:10484 length:657 start_codon:yes stop_codon:yes gene_type:complete
MAGLVVHTAPATEPLSLSETKSYLRVDTSGDDTLITSLIVTARRLAEEHMQRAIITQTLQLFIDTLEDYEDPLWEGMRTGPYLNYYKNYIDLPMPTVTSVSHIKTYDDSDNATTFAANKYYLDNAKQPARIVLRTGETFPTALRVANAIEVQYVTGYADASSVPEPIKFALFQIVAYLYEHRGDMYEGKSALPNTAKKLLEPYVIYSGLGSSKLLQIG